MLNYLMRLESPLRVINLMPPEMMAFGEDDVLRSLAAKPPDFVLLLRRSTVGIRISAFWQRSAIWARNDVVDQRTL